VSLPPLTGPEPLAETHETSLFDCSKPPLNEFLQKHALIAQRANTARSYVALRGSRVVGYYSLTSASIEAGSATGRITRGAGRYPAVPATLLARLAVDRFEAGRGLGKALLKDAFVRFLGAQEIVASRVLLVHAIDDDARQFYEGFGFEASSVDKYHLYLLTKDIKQTLGKTTGKKLGL
jgi:GNAT superfamily N-acetyltransferase